MTNRKEIVGVIAARICISRLSDYYKGMNILLRWIATILVLAAEIASIKLR